MASRDVEEVVTGIWCWERRPRGLRPGEFGGRTSYALAIENDVLLLDPLVDGDDDPVLDVLDDLVRGGVRILVTMPYHARSSESLWRRYRSAKARIYGHPAVATRLADVSGFKAVVGGSGVDGIARFHSIGRPPRSQQPIEIPPVRALVFGDRRRWWNADYLPTLERLANLDIEHVLVTHGRPAIGDGKAALQRALQNAPLAAPEASSQIDSARRVAVNGDAH